MKKPIFFIGEELSEDTRKWLNSQQVQYIEQPVVKIENLITSAIDGYLFFSPSAINQFKLSGNFPHPNSLVFANENSTARAAWTFFTNKVLTSPDSEELSFVQYAIYRWMQENNFLGEHI